MRSARVCRGPQGLACRERSVENVGNPRDSWQQGSAPDHTEGRRGSTAGAVCAERFMSGSERARVVRLPRATRLVIGCELGKDARRITAISRTGSPNTGWRATPQRPGRDLQFSEFCALLGQDLARELYHQAEDGGQAAPPQHGCVLAVMPGQPPPSPPGTVRDTVCKAAGGLPGRRRTV